MNINISSFLNNVIEVDICIPCCNPVRTALKMKAVFSSDTLVSTHKFTRRYNQEDKNQRLHGCDNLKFLNAGEIIYRITSLNSSYILEMSSKTARHYQGFLILRKQ